MDYQSFINVIAIPSCVMSVEDKGDGAWGEIRIICSNESYKKIMGPGYYDGMPYEELVPKDTNFEDFCYRAAVLKQRMRAYVETKELGGWTEEFIVPLESDTQGVGYCQFMMEFTATAEPERMAAVSQSTAEAAIKACVTLMSGTDFRGSVKKVLEDIRELSSALGCRVILVDREARTVSNYCDVVEYSNPSFIKTNTGVIEYALTESWDQLIGSSNDLIINGERDLEEIAKVDPVWVQSLRDYLVSTLILAPLRRGKNVIGYLYVANFDSEKLVSIKEIVEMVAYFLASEISNHLLVKRLEEQSRVDALTGVSNRSAMIRRVESLNGTAVGIVSTDVNGLKIVNDSLGHEAGDKLLRDAADLLLSVFRDRDIYRTGGDEFLVFLTNISRGEFEDRVNMLRRVADQNAGVSLAIGAFWNDGNSDLTTAIRKSDVRMYRDKNDYYTKHPEIRRR